MAAPIYSQSQADGIIAARKSLDFDAWDNRFGGRQVALGEIKVRLPAKALDSSDFRRYAVEVVRDSNRGDASYTLFGELLGYKMLPVGRYEVQRCRHVNPKWWSPYLIPAKSVHRHIYNERAIREDEDWDYCADLCAGPGTDFTNTIITLTNIFLQECHIDVLDRDVRGGLYAPPVGQE